MGAVFSGSPVIESSVLDSTVALICPLRFAHCINCWKVAIAVDVNATILGFRLKKDEFGFKNMGRFGPVLVKPGCFGLILVWVDSAFKVSRLASSGLAPAGLVQFQ